jgi:hypothetical protein
MTKAAKGSLIILLFLSVTLFAVRFAHAQAPPTFGQPTISGIQGVGFEQDLRLDPTNPNRVYTSVPGALSSSTSWIWTSEDGGKTFKWVEASLPKNGKPDGCAGGGDTELAVDADGSVYFNDLTLANFSTARSDDGGVNFPCSNAGVPDTAVDRQWYAVDGNPKAPWDGTGTGAGHTMYLVNDEIGPGAVSCPVSGQVNNVLAMYRSPIPTGVALAGIEFGPAQKVSAPLSCDEGIMGNNEVSPVATKTDQNGNSTLPTAVKHVYVIHDDATFSRILIGRCYPVAFTIDPSGLKCVDLLVATLGTIPPGGTCPDAKTGGNFPTLGIDHAGNLYAVWEQAPQDTSNCTITGDTLLKYSYSVNEGKTWSTPITVPTPGLHNNVFAWVAAGDNGRVDIAWYGTATAADPDNATCGTNLGHIGGPDSTTNGIWSLYVVQTLNGHAGSPTFTAPILAGEHYVHKGTIQTVLGGQCGDRTLGDFLQLRVGSRGEAQIAYADSNNANETSAPHGMYVRQNGGTGVFPNVSVVGDPILLNAANDPAGDGERESAGVGSANIANLDILQSSFSQPAPADCHTVPSGTPCYRVKMIINNMSLTLPPPPTPPALPDTVAVWLTQWLVPADPGCTSTAPLDDCKNGGKNPFVYLKSDGTNGTCWSGQNAVQRSGTGGGVTLTYPGDKQITAPGACSFTTGPFGTITIDVPIADVSLVLAAPLSNRLFSVTASTMSLLLPPEDPPAVVAQIPPTGPPKAIVRRLGGQPFDLIDVVRAYDFVPGAGGGGGGGGCHQGHGDGHINGEHSGQAHFHFDENKCDGHNDEEVDADDSSGSMHFQSTSVLSAAFDTVAHTITIVGVGLNNGIPVTFTAFGIDNGATALDVFSLTLSDGYTNSGNLLDGGITLQ